MLPADLDAAAFDAWQEQPAAWQPALQPLVDALGGGLDQPAGTGTVLVLLGTQRVLKVYPPFLHDHAAWERAVLPLLTDRLSVPTPRLMDAGTHDGWPWLLMTRLPGVPMTGAWPALPEAGKCALLRQIGALASQVHALPVPAALRPLAPPWADFVARQRAGCFARQQRTGLPAHLLAQLEAFLDGPLPDDAAGNRDVVLTGEYTPMNLLVDAGDGARLSGMFDFGDGLLGHRAYDWLGPLCFLAAGQPARRLAFVQGLGLGADWDAPQRRQLLRLMLLHRYSCLRAQISLPDWQQAPTFEDLAERLWGG